MKHLQFKVFVSLVGILLLIGTIMPTLAQEAVSIAPPDGHNPDFDATAAEESYWYSRYNLMSLVMQSGNGMMADVPMDMVMGAGGMVDANPDDGDSVTVPQNVALLGMVYAGGDPHFITAMNPDDFGTMRWVGGDASVTLEASSWTIIKETEWARLFHVDKHFGTPTDNFGAQQRFAGMVMALSAKMQVMAWLQSPDAFETDLSGQYVMLEALSDTGSMLAA